MKVAQLFNPLHAMAQSVTATDVDALKCFRFASRPDLAKELEKMKQEITRYNALYKVIKPEGERTVPAPGKAGKDGKLVDSFIMQLWWRANKKDLTAFFRILQAVAAHSPNSCAPEAVFSILNDSFDSDQRSAYAIKGQHTQITLSCLCSSNTMPATAAGFDCSASGWLPKQFLKL